MSKTTFFILSGLMTILSCGSSDAELTNNSNQTDAQEETDPRTSVISESENKKNTDRLLAAIEKAKSNPINDTIIHGFVIGMSEPDFDVYVQELAAKNELKKSGNQAYDGEFIFEFSDGSTTNVDYSCSASGVFKNFPQIGMRTPFNCDDMNEVHELRNKFIDWAIEKYGSEYYVTINHSYPDGTDENKATNNFTWIVGSYRVDIVIGSCSVGVAYSGL